MNLIITRQFHKDVKKLNDKKIKGKVKTIVLNIQQAKGLEEIPDIKKVKDPDEIFSGLGLGIID